MTDKEAIKYLQQLYPNGGHCWLDEQRIEAIGMAIQALQEESVNKQNLSNVERIGKDWKEEPVSEDLEEAAWFYADMKACLDKSVFTQKEVNEKRSKLEYNWEDIRLAFKAGAERQFERVKEALLSEVLPCFMRGGEADEVVAKLEEVLNQKK